MLLHEYARALLLCSEWEQVISNFRQLRLRDYNSTIELKKQHLKTDDEQVEGIKYLIKGDSCGKVKTEIFGFEVRIWLYR